MKRTNEKNITLINILVLAVLVLLVLSLSACNKPTGPNLNQKYHNELLRYFFL